MNLKFAIFNYWFRKYYSYIMSISTREILLKVLKRTQLEFLNLSYLFKILKRAFLEEKF